MRPEGKSPLISHVKGSLPEDNSSFALYTLPEPAVAFGNDFVFITGASNTLPVNVIESVVASVSLTVTVTLNVPSVVPALFNDCRDFALSVTEVPFLGLNVNPGLYFEFAFTVHVIFETNSAV